MSFMSGAEPFILPGSDRGILAVHGITGSPAEMRLFGEYANHQGYTVLAPRLCGHGTHVKDMAPLTWPYWYASVVDGYHMLQGLCRDITVVGLSMGGLLALKLASEKPVSAVVSLSAPIHLFEPRLKLLPVYRLFRSYEPNKRKVFPDLDPSYSVGYEKIPLASLDSLLSLIKHVAGLLPLVEVPILVAHSKVEHTVQPSSAQYIFDHVRSRDKELKWLRKSGHVITLDCERGQLFEAIANFLDKVQGGVSDE